MFPSHLLNSTTISVLFPIFYLYSQCYKSLFNLFSFDNLALLLLIIQIILVSVCSMTGLVTYLVDFVALFFSTDLVPTSCSSLLAYSSSLTDFEHVFRHVYRLALVFGYDRGLYLGPVLYLVIASLFTPWQLRCCFFRDFSFLPWFDPLLRGQPVASSVVGPIDGSVVIIFSSVVMAFARW